MKSKPTTRKKTTRKSRPGRSEEYTPEQVIDAVDKANGLLAGTARILGCSRQTVYNYAEKYETVKKAIKDAGEATTDMVEDQLLKQIRGGNITAIIFYLKTKAKDRGYIERQEHSGPDGQPLPSPQVIEIVKTYEKEPGE